MTHVADGETTQWREVGERFNAHGLRWDQRYHGSITRLDEFRVLFGSLAGTTIAFLLDFGEFAGNVSSVAIQNGGITIADLAGVVENNNLGEEVGSSLGRVDFGIASNESTTQFLNRDVLDVETNVVTCKLTVGISQILTKVIN